MQYVTHINGDEKMQEQKEKLEEKQGAIYVYSTNNCRPINVYR